MKILHVIPAVAKRYGGPSTAIFPMCRALQEAGCDAKICTTSTDGRGTLPVKTGEWIEYEGVETIFFPAAAKEFKYSREMARWLEDHVGDFDVAHIHAVFNHSSIVAARACRRRQVPYIVRPLGTLDPWSMRQKPLKKKLFWNSFGKRMLAVAAAVHYTSEGEKLAVESTLSVNHGIVVPLGVEIPLITSQSAIHNPQFEPPYILFLSRLHPKKGLEVLIEAFASVVTEEQFRNWKLLIAGDGDNDYVRSLKAIVNRLDADSSVKFLGWLDEAEKFQAFSGASLFVLPSYQENFGISVLEAMNSDVPVIVSPQVNIAPDIRAANAGWISAVDQNALHATLREALTSPKELTVRGIAASSLARRFTWRTVTPQLVRMYKTSAALPAEAVA